jgi:type 1 glutamine amidotransferase
MDKVKSKNSILKTLLIMLMIGANLLSIYGQEDNVTYNYKDGSIIAEFERIDDLEHVDYLLSKIGSSIAITDSLNLISGKKLNAAGWELIYVDDEKIVYEKELGKLASSSSDAHIFMDEDPIFLEKNYNLDVRYGVNQFKRESVRQKEDSLFTFKYAGKEKTESVYLSGTFNEWSTMSTPMKRINDEWQIDAVLPKGKNLYKFIVDGEWITDPYNQQKETDYEGNTNSVFFVENFKFKLDGYQDAKRVYVSGSFNEWQESELRMKIDKIGWILPMYLRDGIHTYKFIVDGTWILDPANPKRTLDGYGNENSFISTGTPFLFETKAFDTAEQVVLSGSFNNWNEAELPMNKVGGSWQTEIAILPGNYEYKYIVDGVWNLDPSNSYTIGIEEYKNSVIAVDPNYAFLLVGFEDADEVLLTGTFNNWSEDGYTMTKVDGVWVMNLFLPKGKTRYKFIVDGKWVKDPSNPLYEKNQYGSFDSILWIK